MLKIKMFKQEQSYVLQQRYVLRLFLNWATEAVAQRIDGILFQALELL